MRGVALKTDTNRDWLVKCPAVTAIQESGVSNMIQFSFEEKLRPPAETVPEDVYFDLSAAPF